MGFFLFSPLLHACLVWAVVLGSSLRSLRAHGEGWFQRARYFHGLSTLLVVWRARRCPLFEGWVRIVHRVLLINRLEDENIVLKMAVMKASLAVMLAFAHHLPFLL